MLVSGYIGKEGKTETVSAQGVVLGEIWYKSEVSIPLDSLFQTLTGEQMTRHYLIAFGKEIPIWGFGKTEFEQFESFPEQRAFRLFQWSLPIQYKKNNRI